MRKIKKRGKKGQQILGLSFSVIFSLLLIIFFIIIAFIAIRAFLKTQNCAKVGIFVEDFQTEVEKSWNSQSLKFEFDRNIPGGIQYVCFANLSRFVFGPYEEVGDDITIFIGRKANMFFYPRGPSCEMPFHFIDHLDIEKITSSENPYCIPVEDGNARINIIKEFNERFVRVSR